MRANGFSLMMLYTSKHIGFCYIYVCILVALSNIEGSVVPAQMYRLARTFAARIHSVWKQMNQIKTYSPAGDVSMGVNQESLTQFENYA